MKTFSEKIKEVRGIEANQQQLGACRFKTFHCCIRNDGHQACGNIAESWLRPFRYP